MMSKIGPMSSLMHHLRIPENDPFFLPEMRSNELTESRSDEVDPVFQVAFFALPAHILYNANGGDFQEFADIIADQDVGLIE
jgi:hypothetical protein